MVCDLKGLKIQDGLQLDLGLGTKILVLDVFRSFGKSSNTIMCKILWTDTVWGTRPEISVQIFSAVFSGNGNNVFTPEYREEDIEGGKTTR